jgi:hypothetical protein
VAYRHHDVGMRLIGLIEHPVPGGPGGPLIKARTFYVALRDKIVAGRVWDWKVGTI